MILGKAFKKENRVLLAELVRTDFKLRYQGSVLGYTWSLLRPLLLFAILYVVFARFLKIGGDVPHYPIYLLFGIVLWTFFSDMTTQSLGSIVDRGDLIRKIRIPRWIIIVSSSMSAFINLGLNLVIVFVFMLVNKVDLLGSSIFLPLVLLEIYIIGLGFSLLLSAAYVKYRDINYIWEVVIQAGFYATPIIYPLSLIVNETYQKILLLNPIAQAIQDGRYALVTHDSANITIDRAFHSGAIRFVPIIFSVLILIAGLLYFRKEAKHFAENL